MYETTVCICLCVYPGRCDDDGRVMCIGKRKVLLTLRSVTLCSQSYTREVLILARLLLALVLLPRYLDLTLNSTKYLVQLYWVQFVGW